MQHYEAVGNVRGNCGHHHKTAEAATRCAEKDMAACKKQGGYSDRFAHIIKDGQDKGAVEA